MVKVLAYVYLVISLIAIAGLGYELYTTQKAVEQTLFKSYILPKDQWVCALEFIPFDEPENKQCVAIMDKRIVK